MEEKPQAASTDKSRRFTAEGITRHFLRGLCKARVTVQKSTEGSFSSWDSVALRAPGLRHLSGTCPSPGVLKVFKIMKV